MKIFTKRILNPRKINTLRSRLLVSFVMIALSSSLAISFGAIILGYYNGHQQVLNRLVSVSSLKEQEIRTWVNSLQYEIAVSMNEEYALDRLSRIGVILSLEEGGYYYDYYSRSVRNRLQKLVSDSKAFLELSLINLNGRVLLSTDLNLEGVLYAREVHFDQWPTGVYQQILIDSGDGYSETILMSSPIFSYEGKLIGFIAGHARLDTLLSSLMERTGLDHTGKSYLVSSLLQAIPASPEDAGNTEFTYHSRAIDSAVVNQQDGAGIYRDYHDVSVIGVYKWLPELSVGLIVEQNLMEAFGIIFTSLAVNLVISLLAVIFAVIASLFVTRSITEPLINLADTAVRISDGDLNLVARVQQNNEIGRLAVAFNSMTSQLRNLINSLEQRVRERTQILGQRALQLETSSRLSREITSILDIDLLLRRVVELIQQAFGYYHVQIFLLDEENNLNLKAHTGTINLRYAQLMINRPCLKREVILQQHFVVVNNELESEKFLFDELLPGTKSEVIIPLQHGEHIIGTLEIYSKDINAFSDDDIPVLQSLGDQIAIAIENARLYEESRKLAALEERNRLAGELHDSVSQLLYTQVLYADTSQKLILSENTALVSEYLQQICDASYQALREMRLMIHQLRPQMIQTEGLMGALQHRLDTVERRAKIDAVLIGDPQLKLPAEIEDALYFIAQEALNNALKHSMTQTVTVSINVQDGKVMMEVKDTGRGFVVQNAREGMGLSNLRDRTGKLGGELSIDSSPGVGTRVKVSLQLERAYG